MKRTCHRETYNKVDNFSEVFIMRNLGIGSPPTKQPIEDMQDLLAHKKIYKSPKVL